MAQTFGTGAGGSGGGATLNRGGGVLRRDSIFRRPGNTGYNPQRAPRPARTASSSGYTAVSDGGSPAGAAYYDGGGGYDGGGVAAAPPPPRLSLKDYIDQDFGYRQANDEYGDKGRRIREFDAETEKGRAETERDQERRRTLLGQDLAAESLGSAEDLAGRGMLRSGGAFVAQDEINKEGDQRRSAIDDLLAQFISQRGSGRNQLAQQNRAALNEQINQITQRYQQQYGI